jgi:hypothetical protein
MITTAKIMFFYAAHYLADPTKAFLIELFACIDLRDFVCAIRSISKASKRMLPDIVFKCTIHSPNDKQRQSTIILGLAKLFGVDASLQDKLCRFPDRFLKYLDNLVSFGSKRFLLKVSYLTV